MKLARTLEVWKNKIRVRERPIRPQYPGTSMVKVNRALLTPLDSLLISGLFNPGHNVLGTLAYGINLSQSRADEPSLVTTHPISCDYFPVTSREGVASEITSIESESLSPINQGSRYPEMSYIYRLSHHTADSLKGVSLIIGGNGLQTMILSTLTDKNTVITGLKGKLRVKTESRIVGHDKIKDSNWDTIVVWTMNTEKTDWILDNTSSKRILVHPFTACLYRRLKINPERHESVSVLHPPKNIETDYRRLDEIVSRTGLHDTIPAEEKVFDKVTPYLTIVFDKG